MSDWFYFGSNSNIDSERFKLKQKYGKDIRVYDERDPLYFEVIDEWLPVPIYLDQKMQKKIHKQIEKQVLKPFGTSYCNSKRKYTPKRKHIEYQEYVESKISKKNRSPIPEFIKEIIHAERGIICEHCKQNHFDEYHHINKDPSDHRPENILILCYRCHKNEHRK